MKIETFLPVFSGFYGTIWEFNEEDYMYETGLKFDDFDVDLDGYERDTIESICDFVEMNCPFINSIELQEIVSPKEYNFKNDSANVVINIDVQSFAAFLRENKELLNEYLRSKYTSHSGFISFYSNNYQDWHDETDGFTKLDADSHRLGSLLEFYFGTEFENAEEAAYDFCKQLELLYITERVKLVSNLDRWDVVDVAKNVIHSDFQPFGYLELLYNDYKKRYPDYWVDRLAENECDLIISEANVIKVNLDLSLLQD